MSQASNEMRVLLDDPVVAEVRGARAALFAAAGGDIHAFCRRAQERQRASGHPVVTGPSGSADRLDRTRETPQTDQ